MTSCWHKCEDVLKLFYQIYIKNIATIVNFLNHVFQYVTFINICLKENQMIFMLKTGNSILLFIISIINLCGDY